MPSFLLETNSVKTIVHSDWWKIIQDMAHMKYTARKQIKKQIERKKYLKIVFFM